jgi:hypothetical protein
MGGLIPKAADESKIKLTISSGVRPAGATFTSSTFREGSILLVEPLLRLPRVEVEDVAATCFTSIIATVIQVV